MATEYDLIKQAQQVDKVAREILILQNWPLACWLGLQEHRKRGYWCKPFLDEDDFKLICGLGLVYAIDKCVLSKLKGKFFSYAKYWCYHFLNQEIAKAALIHVGQTTMYYYRTGKLGSRGTKDVKDFLERKIERNFSQVLDKHLGPDFECELKELFEE